MMRFGVGLQNYGRSITFDALRRVAVTAEELGYDSVWTTDHVIVPSAARESYGHIFECMVTLAIIAAITKRVRLGTSVIVLPMRNPILFAKQAASLDVASGGWMIVGLGVGRIEAEFRNLNANFKNRGRRLNEDITLLRRLWSSEVANFHGKYTDITDSVFAPLPLQTIDAAGTPGIPIWIGGGSEPAWKRAARVGDGWHPNGVSPQVFAAGIKYIREQKPLRPFTFSMRLSIDMTPGALPTYELRGKQYCRLAGSNDAIRAGLWEYVGIGAEHIALFFPMDDIAVTLQQMERFMRDIAPDFKV
jgi:probable F420-dependent oxidoreductase